MLSGCPRKNQPLNFDQIFDFLQTFCARQGWYKINENTFRLLVNFRRDFRANVVDTRSPQNRPFVESKLANFGKSAADRIFIQKI